MALISLQLKFSVLLVGLLVAACLALAVLATRHERGALEREVARRGQDLAAHLAGAAKEPLLGVLQGDFGPELQLERLVGEARSVEGVSAVRILDRHGDLLVGFASPPQLGAAGSDSVEAPRRDPLRVAERERTLSVSAPISYSDVHLGEIRLDFDLGLLVEPVVHNSRRQLALAAVLVVALGVGSGLLFVALLVGPLRRLREGVESFATGDTSARVVPSSRDEVGELARAFNAMGDALEEKQRIQRAFGRYVGDDVLEQVRHAEQALSPGGIEREVSILFADIRHFTQISEGMRAQDVVTLLNQVFQCASDAVIAESGTLDKFMGDAVMAYFGAPLPAADHAQRAVRSAIAMQRSLAARNARESDLHPGRQESLAVSIGIGIHTGKVVVGNIGSDQRMDFTAVGDAVNVAHRIEKLARSGEILISEAVRTHGTQEVASELRGEFQLSGRAQPVRLYALTVESDIPPPDSAKSDP